MGVEQTEAEKVETVRGFHRLLRGLVDAKIPVCLELGTGCAPSTRLERLVQQFEDQIARQGTIEGFLADDRLPDLYRDGLEQWIRGERTSSLDRLATGGEGQRYYHNAVGFVLLQASLVFGSLFVGMVAFCWWLLPKMQTLQAESFSEPGIGLRVLGLIGSTLSYWGTAILITAFFVFCFRRRVLSWLLCRISPSRDDSFALTEFQSLFSRPARFQWMVSWVVVLCGFGVLLQALSVLGVTFELLAQLVVS